MSAVRMQMQTCANARCGHYSESTMLLAVLCNTMQCHTIPRKTFSSSQYRYQYHQQRQLPKECKKVSLQDEKQKGIFCKYHHQHTRPAGHPPLNTPNTSPSKPNPPSTTHPKQTSPQIDLVSIPTPTLGRNLLRLPGLRRTFAATAATAVRSWLRCGCRGGSSSTIGARLRGGGL